MINRFSLLRNVGQFDSVTVPATAQYQKLTVVYAENGRGKTTLTAILRSFSTGDPLPIRERRRLGALHPPHVILHCTTVQQPAIFQNDTWSRTRPNIAVFDDSFINNNIYSGLSVDPEHRQNLHEIIIGAQGVTLNQQLQELVAQVEEHNRTLRIRARDIPAEVLGGLSVDDFCALLPLDNIDAAIEESVRSLAAAQEQDPVRNQGFFQQLRLPLMDVAAIELVLQHDLPDLDAAAAARVQTHISELGHGGEAWIADGILHIPGQAEGEDAGTCPFCAQSLAMSPVLTHYRGYFSEAYADLKRVVSQAVNEISRTHSADSLVDLERTVRINGERREFWSRFCAVPNTALDTANIAAKWRDVSERVVGALRAKQAAPLERMQLSPEAIAIIADFEELRVTVEALNTQMEEANEAIRTVKAQAVAADPAVIAVSLTRLRATRARHAPTTAAICATYLAEKFAKAATEVLRDQARAALEAYRTGVFPTYQASINRYLQLFNAGFHLDSIQPVNTRGGSACSYNVVINNSPVPVAGRSSSPGDHGFHNTLSAGDRNALALAFFFASLDQCSDLTDKVVVIDDPVSSLDEHRCLTTIQEIRRLAHRVAQVIIFSHSKPFLCALWDGMTPTFRAALHVVRQGTGSTLQEWDVNNACISEHDRRHTLLREYLEVAGGNNREVAVAIRPLLEGFFRVACPQHFPPGTLLGPFRGLCEQRIGTAQEILNQGHVYELRDLVEYGNRFHHDTNAAWQTEVINDLELLGYVRRTLDFAKR